MNEKTIPQKEDTFNRTILELKQMVLRQLGAQFLTFNRTILELKLYKS